MTVEIVQYKYQGKWGPFKVKSACEECDLTTAILRDMMGNEFRDLDVTFETRPWLNNWIFLFLKGARHAPIILVDDHKFYSYSKKNPLFDRVKLKDVVLKLLDKS